MALKKLGLFDDTQNNTNSLFDNIPTTPYSSMAVTIGPLRFGSSFASGTDVHSGAHAGLASPAPELVAAVAPTDEPAAAITISDYAVDTALNAYIAADTPAGSFVEGYGFNDAGAWGGAAPGYPVGTNSAFIFNNGSATVINDPNGTNGTSLFGVSNNGDYAVGSYINSEGATSFYLDDAGVYTDISAELPTPDATDYIAGVNNSGEIAGYTETSSLAAQGFVVSDGTVTYLTDSMASLPDMETTGINDNGDVTGYYFNPQTDSADVGFVESNGVYTTISDPYAGTDASGDGTFPLGITNDGEVYGVFVDASGIAEGFVEYDGVYTTVDYPGAYESEVLGVNSAGQILGVDYPTSASSYSYFTAQQSPACYARGTLILTDRGEIAVESLRIGDTVITASGATREIKWIGHRAYIQTFANANPHLLPICFRAGSLGRDLPRRDLYVSPQHAMFIDGALIPAETLVNGASIIKTRRIDATLFYWHVELETHDVLLAEGAPSESFVDDNSRNIFHNAPEYWASHPEDIGREAIYCAPRIEDGYELAAIRARLARIAGIATPQDHGGLLGSFTITGNSIAGWARNELYPSASVCLDILVDGRRVAQTLANRSLPGVVTGPHAFAVTLPAGCSGVVEVTRSIDGARLHALAPAMQAA